MVCIITYARSWQALVAVRALGKSGINIITADSEEFATATFSKYSRSSFVYTDPDVNEKKFVKELIAKAKEYKKKYDEEVVIIPIHKETYVISKYKKQIEKVARVCVEDYDKIMRIHNKSTVLKEVKKARVRSPRTFIVKDVLELYKLTPKLKFPVFIKLNESAASVGILKVDKRDELIYKYSEIVEKFKLKKNDYPIIQEGVEGKDYCVTAIYNKGKFRAMQVYMNIKSYPYKSGTGVYRKNVKIEAMEKEAKKFLNAIKWHGVVEMDFRMGKDKKPYFIEANPRFWGGLNQSVSSNLNYPKLAYTIAMFGDCETVTKINKDVRTENLVSAVMALGDEIAKDERKLKQLENLRTHWDNAFSEKDKFDEHITSFVDQLKDITEKRYAFKAIEEFFKRRELVKDDIIDDKDPFVVMGILYPINLFLKYGKIDKYMLTGENPAGNKKQ